MYQTIDDPEEEGRHSGFSIWPFLIGAVLAGLVFFLVWLFSPGSPAQPGQAVETPASRSAYLRAISEESPAMRRALLLDYQRIYPDSDRAMAVTDQLDVIQQAEVADWEALTDIVYDVRADADKKRDALRDYKLKWNSALLGGRGEELDALVTEIDETAAAQPLPDRSLANVESPIPNSLPSDDLAGAAPGFFRSPVLEPYDEPLTIRPPTEDIIVQPTVRRNASPRYPRSARRRNIGAIVIVAMNINEKGRVDMTEIVSVEADRYGRDFVKAAERAAMRTRFNPKTINGEPVPAIGVRKRYIFRPSD